MVINFVWVLSQNYLASAKFEQKGSRPKTDKTAVLNTFNQWSRYSHFALLLDPGFCAEQKKIAFPRDPL